ncbi:HAD-IA family hydrolase [Pseudomonas sp. RIT-To-2]|uniref:HAD-IA family hydrolase n=1 Tax=Pseudomonas sp. RIT-To-2 TaxID=3462541 RepID=UPI0024136386
MPVTLTVAALLLDMDGTLVDSTAVVERTWLRFARRHHLDPALILHSAHGRRSEETVRQFAPAGVDVAAETARIIAEELLDTEGIVAVPGALALLQALKGARWAVVTSASRALAERRLRAAGLPVPHLLIAAEDVSEGKPAPDGYEAAARQLCVEPQHCLAVEDAPAGLKAAHAAHCQVVAVATTLAPPALGEPLWVKDLRGLIVTGRTKGALHLSITLGTPGEPRSQGSGWPPAPHQPGPGHSDTGQ